MKKYLLIAAAAAMVSGCATFDDWFGGRPSTSNAPRQQLSDGRASFDQKIKNASGRPLTRVQKDWGALEPGVSRDGLTVYTWRQTARLSTPAGEVTQAKTGQETASCLAMFIVNANGVVVDASSEGQCFDYRLMPAWRPYITESTDGRTGAVFQR